MDKGKGKDKDKVFYHEDFPGLSLPPPPSMMEDNPDPDPVPKPVSPSASTSSATRVTPSRRPTTLDDSEGYSESEETDRDRDRDTGVPQQGIAGAGGRKRRKRSEPTSPVVVVLYVVALYLIFQILTRSDEKEVLGHLHLPTSSSSFMQSQSPRSNMDISQQPYHLPYQFPPIPNPIPSIPKDKEDGGVSFGRLLLGILMYPLYLIITLLATPLPIILNLLHILKEIVVIVLLYPILSIVKAIFRTFVLGPWGVIRGILDAFYPVYVFVGGVVGVGCVMGLGAGWVGRLMLDWVIAWKDRRSYRRWQKKQEAVAARAEEINRRIKASARNAASSYDDDDDEKHFDAIYQQYQNITNATPSFTSKVISPNSVTYLVPPTPFSTVTVPKVGLSRVTQSTFNPLESISEPQPRGSQIQPRASAMKQPRSQQAQSLSQSHRQAQLQGQNRPQPIQTAHTHSRTRSTSDESQQITTPTPIEVSHVPVSLFDESSDGAYNDSSHRQGQGGASGTARKIPYQKEEGAGRGTAREGPVVGIRKRGVRESGSVRVG
ncbi:hypothetical protein IAT40_005593 [Kwoniella sp. CBS 6097]